MTREEAVAVLRELIETIEDDQAYSQLTYGIYKDGYRRIDACKAAIAALRGERDTTTTSWYSKKLYCDTCEERIIGKKHNYCPMCGRKLEVEG